MPGKSTRSLSRWALIMAGDVGPILAGCEGMNVLRTSTPLVSFDLETGDATTATGRPYHLVRQSDPGYALMAFHSLWNADGKKIRVVSPEEAVELIESNGNAPFRHRPEDQARLDLRKLQFMASQTRTQMAMMGLDENEAALRAGLTAKELQGLLGEDLSVISADKADQAFVQLMASSGI